MRITRRRGPAAAPVRAGAHAPAPALPAIWAGAQLLLAACGAVAPGRAAGAAGPIAAPAAPAPPVSRDVVRDRMVADQLELHGIRDARVLAAMRSVPRHEFVPPALRDRAYDDEPLPIGHGQTISQPYVVALMTELADVQPDDRVLEIGTGSGYQAAILAELAREVYTIEIVEPLARSAAETLQRLGYANVHTRHGDGWRGWPDAAPFDAIVVTAAPPHVPAALLEQLRSGGRLVIPVGRWWQRLEVHRKQADGSVEVERVTEVRFVPMTGGTAE